MFWMVIGYMFLFVFRPFEVWPVLAPFHIERIYMVCLLVGMFCWTNKRYISNPINNMVIGFFVVMLAACAFAFNREDAFPVAFEYFKLLVFYFVILLSIQDPRALKIFVLAYVLIMFMYVGKSAWEFFVNGRLWYRMGIVRMTGADFSYSDPNYFAGSIAYSLPFLVAMLRSQLRPRLMKLLLWSYAVLAVVCIIYSGSRSGMVTALFFLVLLWLGSRHKVKGLVLLPVLLLVTWTAMPESYKVRFESSFVEGKAAEAGQKGADESAKGRIAGLQTGFKTFLSYPLLGIGPGNFKYAWAGATGEVIGGSAHNMYGQVLGELGGVGFCTFFTLVGLTFGTLRRVKKSGGEALLRHQDSLDPVVAEQLTSMRIVATGASQTLILLLFNGNFGHNLYRFNYLWIAAIAVLAWHFMKQIVEGLEGEGEDMAKAWSLVGSIAVPDAPSGQPAAALGRAAGEPGHL